MNPKNFFGELKRRNVYKAAIACLRRNKICRRFLYSTCQISAKFAAFYIAACSFIEGSCGSPYHGRVFLNSACQMAPTENLSRG